MAKNKNFGYFMAIWLGEFVSSIGSGLTAFALGVYVFRATGSAAAVSLVSLCAFLPSILLNPVGGVLADRFDRRLMMICGDLFSAAGLLYMLICFRSGRLETFQVCVGVTISAVFLALLEPAYKATVTDLLTREEYSRASGLMQLAASAKYLLSPVIGGFLLTVTDTGTILVLDISTILITVSTVALVRSRLHARTKPAEKPAFFKDMKGGWKAVAGDRGVFAMVALISAVTFYLGILQTLLPPMVLSFSDSKTLGLVETISAAGMLPGSLLMGVFTVKRYIPAMSAGFMLAGVAMAFLGASSIPVLITTAGCMFFCTLPCINACADATIRCRIPDRLQGRAWGLISVLSQLGYVLAYACAGVLADGVFNPMLKEGGILSGTVGRLIGTGPGRGIGFMFVLSGVSVFILGFIMGRIKIIRSMEPPADVQTGSSS